MKNVIITKEQLEFLVANKKKISENIKDSDHKMFKQQLYTIEQIAKQLHDMVDDDTELEDWVVSKVAVADHIMTAVAKNILYGESQDDLSGMDKLNPDELIIGK